MRAYTSPYRNFLNCSQKQSVSLMSKYMRLGQTDKFYSWVCPKSCCTTQTNNVGKTQFYVAKGLRNFNVLFKYLLINDMLEARIHINSLIINIDRFIDRLTHYDDVVLRHTLPVFTGLGRCPIVSWDFAGAVSIFGPDALPVIHQ